MLASSWHRSRTLRSRAILDLVALSTTLALPLATRLWPGYGGVLERARLATAMIRLSIE